MLNYTIKNELLLKRASLLSFDEPEAPSVMGAGTAIGTALGGAAGAGAAGTYTPEISRILSKNLAKNKRIAKFMEKAITSAKGQGRLVRLFGGGIAGVGGLLGALTGMGTGAGISAAANAMKD